MLKESALAKEAPSVFSGFRQAYNKADVNGVTRSLGFFGEATNKNDKSSAGGGLSHPPITPSKSELTISPAFQGDHVINRKVRPPGHINSTIDNEAVTRHGTDIPSWRTNRICKPYTISEDLSGDCGNQILSRIGKRKRDSEQIRILIGRSDIDSWSLRHQNKVSCKGPTQVEWARYRVTIIQLYSRLPLEAVRSFMETEHGFKATQVTPVHIPR